MTALAAAFRAAGPRIVAALAARFRDLDLAEEGFAEACARAVAAWGEAPPARPDAWLFRTAERAALDALRRRRTRARAAPEVEEAVVPEVEAMLDDAAIPDERLRLIFVCCHPALASDVRAALTLRLVCGLATQDVARAFFVAEATMAQRLVRAKAKIAAAGVPFDLPARGAWPERLAAVLTTLEIAYARAHEDAAGAGAYAGLGPELVRLTALLTTLLPGEAEVLALAATVHFAEGRRPARLDAAGAMVPLAAQDPAAWDATLVAAGQGFLALARGLAPAHPRVLQADLQGIWCARTSLAAPPPWPAVLAGYDRLLGVRDDALVRLNRLVALAEVAGPAAALAELPGLDASRFGDFAPFHAVRADLLARTGAVAAAVAAYDAALALTTTQAERDFLRERRARIAAG
ncbi:RNA polymerase subunit sigma-24 [alpha proteobacterium AAP81b]|nr:RNA polymerase subunit sigma-24 [alpha proteobacterium AAP81b]